MNTIKITLKESGSVAGLYLDFRMYKGAYNNKSIDIYVPKSLIYENANSTFITAVKTAALLTAPNGERVTTKSYYAGYKNDTTINGVDYAVYEQIMPKEYSVYAGTQEIITNVINIDNTDRENPKVLEIVTTQKASLTVLESAYISTEEVIDPTQMEVIEAELNNKQNINDNRLQTENKTIVEAINEVNAVSQQNKSDIAGLISGETPIKETEHAQRADVALTANEASGYIAGGQIAQTFELKANVDETGNNLTLTLDQETYELTAELKTKDGEVLSTQTVDLPIESMVVDARYDPQTGILTLVLQNGRTIEIPIQTIISGFVPDTRTINDKRLNQDITLTAGDVGAYTKDETDTGISSAKDETISMLIELFGTNEGAIDGEITYIIENSEEYEKYRTNGREFLFDLHTTEQVLTDDILINIGYNGATYSAYNYVTNESLTYKDIKPFSKTAEDGTTSVVRAMYVQNQEIASFVVVVGDYATGGGGGGLIDTISVNGVQQPIVNRNANLSANVKNESEYSTEGGALFIGKGTLENVKNKLSYLTTHQEMSETYDPATATNIQGDLYAYAGQQPASYDAIKTYIESQKPKIEIFEDGD